MNWILAALLTAPVICLGAYNPTQTTGITDYVLTTPVGISLRRADLNESGTINSDPSGLLNGSCSRAAPGYTYTCTFATPYPETPTCFFSESVSSPFSGDTSAITSKTISTTTIVVTFAPRTGGIRTIECWD